MPYFYSRLKQIISEKGISFHRLQFLSQVPAPLFSQWKSGKRLPSDNDLEKLARVEELDLSLDRLRAWRALDKEGRGPIEEAVRELGGFAPEGFYRFPCRGTVSAGDFTSTVAPEDLTYFEFIDVSHYACDMFCLKIAGNSMAPEFQDGGLLLLRPAQSFRNNGLYVFKTDEQSSTFKVLRFLKEKAALFPLNPEYPVLPLDEISIDEAYEVIEYKISYL